MDTVKIIPRTNFKSIRKIEPIYTGGKVIVSPDSKLITASGEDVYVTCLNTGAMIHKLQGDTEIITSMALRPVIEGRQEKRQLVTGSRSLQLTLWDLESGKIVRTWRAHEAPAIMMEFDPTGKLLATGSADSTIRLWDLDKAICTHNLRGHGGIISALRFHPDPNRWTLYSGSDDCQIRVWDLLTKKCLACLKGHVSVVRGLDVSPCGWLLVSGSRDKIINIWNLRNLQLESSFPIYESIESVGVLGGYLIGGEERVVLYTGGEGGRVRLWDIKTHECVYTQPTGEQQVSLVDVQHCASQASLVCATSDQNIQFLSLADNLKRSKQIIGYNDEVIDLLFVSSYLLAITNSNQLRLFDCNSADSCLLANAHKDIILCADKHQESLTVLTGSKDNTAKLWRVNSDASDDILECVGELVGHTESITAAALAKKRLAFCLTASQDCTVKKWQLSDSLKCLYTVKAHDKDINSLDIAPNDRMFATGSQDRTVKMWSVETGELLGTLKGHKRGVWCVRFSPVEQLIASSSGDKTIKLWSTQDMTCLKTLEGHTNSVLRLEFLTMGTQLLSTGSDGLCKMWTVKSGECVMTRDDHEDKLWALAVKNGDVVVSGDTEEDEAASTDVCMIATGSGDSLITIYRDTTHLERQQQHREEEQRLLQDQDLSNFISTKDYSSAIKLALRLRKSKTLCDIIGECLDNNNASSDAAAEKRIISPQVDELFGRLSMGNIKLLLQFARDWNTNSKYAPQAQAVVSVLLAKFSARELVEGVEGVKEILDGLIPYTERHYYKADQLQTSAWLVDYTLSEMNILTSNIMQE